MTAKITIVEANATAPTKLLIENPDGITSENIRTIRLGSIIASLGIAPIERPKLKRPKKRKGLNDDFYKQVAEAYRDHVARLVRSPSKAIAEEANTSRDTAKRWIYYARQRGYLPPTTPGRMNARLDNVRNGWHNPHQLDEGQPDTDPEALPTSRPSTP